MSQAPMSVPVRVDLASSRARVHVLIRLVLLAAVAALGYSSIYWLLYLVLPAWAAMLIAQKGGERYLAENGPATMSVLGWITDAYAYLWLLTDTPPAAALGTPMAVVPLRPAETPTAISAMTRLLSSLPALLMLAVASCVAGMLWLCGAVVILAIGRLPAFVSDFAAATLRYQYRLLAYHLSIVDRYPSFENLELTSAPDTSPT